MNSGAKDEETLPELRKGFNKMKGEHRSRERGNASLVSKLEKYDERKNSESNDQDFEVLDEPFGKVRHSSPYAELPKSAHNHHHHYPVYPNEQQTLSLGSGGK